MHALPWPDASFDVATSFRGTWRTTPEALAEIHRVLVPGGRVRITAWGHLKVSPGVWAFAPFRLHDTTDIGLLGARFGPLPQTPVTSALDTVSARLASPPGGLHG